MTTLIYSSTRYTISAKTDSGIQNTHSGNDHTTIQTKPSDKQTDKSNYYDTQYTIPYKPDEDTTNKKTETENLSSKSSSDNLGLKTTAFTLFSNKVHDISSSSTQQLFPISNSASTTLHSEESTHASRASEENPQSTDHNYFTSMSASSLTDKKEASISTTQKTIDLFSSKLSTQYSAKSTTISTSPTSKTTENNADESFNDSFSPTSYSSTLFSKVFNLSASTTNSDLYYKPSLSNQNASMKTPIQDGKSSTTVQYELSTFGEVENRPSGIDQHRSSESQNITEYAYSTMKPRNYSDIFYQNISTTLFEVDATTERYNYNTSTDLYYTRNVINETSTVKLSTTSFMTSPDEKTTDSPIFTTRDFRTTEVVANKSNNIQSLPSTTRVLNLGNSPRICTSSECYVAASRMLFKMNHSTDACEDFYDFACGAMQESVTNEDAENDFVIQKLMQEDVSGEVFLEKFKKFYVTCVKHEEGFIYKDRVAECKTKLQIYFYVSNINLCLFLVRKLVNYLGDFDDGTNMHNFQFNMTKFIAQLLLRQSFPLFEVGMDLDKQTKSYILQVCGMRFDH